MFLDAIDLSITVSQQSDLQEYWPPIGLLLLSPLILAVSAATGLYALLRNLKNGREKRRLDTILKIMDAEQSARFSDAHQRFLACRHSGSLLNLTTPRSASERKDRELVFLFLNHYELISMGIRKGLLSYEIYKEWMGTNVVLTWNEACEFIDKERCASGTKLGGPDKTSPVAPLVSSNINPKYNGRLYSNFQYLAERVGNDLGLNVIPKDEGCSAFVNSQQKN